MIHRVFSLGLLACNASLVGDEHSREALVIDPGDDPQPLLDTIAREGWKVREILITHAHIDHVAGVADVQRLTGAAVAMHPLDQPLYEGLEDQAAWVGMPTPERVPITRWLAHGDLIQCGAHHFTTLFTPGHAPGHVSFYCASESLLISADVLFRGGIGRTDLPGGDANTLLESIHTRLMTLPDATRVVPGHGELTTIGEERHSNPYLSLAWKPQGSLRN
ncbi:MAG: MBL fold metallo-hydrolase [Bryobacterales bacterium]|jgi:glyoxylase-like metal-dependent hydrolase (beta-lactamase superfamily II)|nr:MBL fold metallo-hydrolase [Bryobacterales bacterium]